MARVIYSAIGSSPYIIQALHVYILPVLIILTHLYPVSGLHFVDFYWSMKLSICFLICLKNINESV